MTAGIMIERSTTFEMLASQTTGSAPVKKPADLIRDHLLRYVGPFTAKNAVEMFSRKTLGISADAITMDQAKELLEALGPMLRTLLGKQNAERVLEQLKQELGA